MKAHELTEIAQALFNEGYWQRKFPHDRSILRGFYNLRALKFTDDQIRLYEKALEIAGCIVIAEKFLIDSLEPSNRIELSLLPKFDLGYPSGFVASHEDPLKQFEIQAYLESLEFKYALKQEFFAEVQNTQADREFLPTIHGIKAFSIPVTQHPFVVPN